jgi:hypothetical protein
LRPGRVVDSTTAVMKRSVVRQENILLEDMMDFVFLGMGWQGRPSSGLFSYERKQ